MAMSAKGHSYAIVGDLDSGFEKLTEGFMKEFNIDVKKCLTTPSLANKFFNETV